MGKYSIDVIASYVNGEDIENYDIDALENDYAFMICVINFTNDKRMYNLCSDVVKGNYKFAKFLILKFKSDTSFICDVYDNYMNYSSNELEKADLSILITSILEKRDVDKFIKYKLSLMAFYTKYKVALDNVKSCDVNNKLNMGMGFYVIFDDYYSSVRVSDFFASNFISDIFYDNDIDFEQLIHERFSSFEELEELGINNYLLNFLARYDDMLSSYVTTHLYLLDNLKRKLEFIKSNWDTYLKNLKSLRYEMLYERVSKYISLNNCMFHELDILYILAKEYNMEEELCSYYDLSSDFLDVFSFSKFFDSKSLSFRDLKHYRDVKKVFCDIMFSNRPQEVDDYISDVKDSCIIDFKSNKVKNLHS